ncbi:uncharacterized protein Pyn_07651 [Prunus yedoensis var. nudiflora]|uniref:Syntaxin 6/10/61 N-terminal domain-containing protein n=1 Tax=Prunus yedoensis var. nudiflora TaxID=2094558 RepID=A0A314ULV0_PRUYE|nr:uncharacterized protein Pyn_27310 [Prunus yedoensis var. nudiflora]PQQ01692.1 uncharacterized protein Pyn_07651 [Prunus yedoensis var. nudiflora]
MMVASSFDLWKKDVFFPAAEEVQESVDIMESTYRAWVRHKRERLAPDDLDGLCRELQTALGTAKWQLEEFEKAVRLSYGQRGDDHTTARHKQFIAAIENQISHVETALRESFSMEGKQPLRWVHLDEEECDDFAAFLSGTPQSMLCAKNEYVELGPSVKSSEENDFRRKDVDRKSNAACSRDISDEIKGVKDVITISKDPNFVMEVKGKEIAGMRDDIIYDADRTTNTRKACNSPNYGELRIIIADKVEHRQKLIPGCETHLKKKDPNLSFGSKGVRNCIRQQQQLICSTSCLVGLVHLRSKYKVHRNNGKHHYAYIIVVLFKLPLV